ncbi:MAG: 2-oxoacid:acceptor oxidoreductase family protein, partial [Candidatus Bathyarchaeia archaeon]
MIVNKFSLLIGGEAGAGITRSGSLFAKTCMRGGLNVFCTNDYQSLIRGGHNFYTVRVDTEETLCPADEVNLLIALNAEAITLHKDELSPNGGIIYDPDDPALNLEMLGRKDLSLFPIPLKKIVIEELKEPHNLIMKNTVALGATMALTAYELDLLEEVLKDTFKPEVAESNMKAARIGYEYAKKNFAQFEFKLEKTSKAGKHKIFLSGNEAVGLGAIKAGCKFYASYPM